MLGRLAAFRDNALVGADVDELPEQCVGLSDGVEFSGFGAKS